MSKIPTAEEFFFDYSIDYENDFCVIRKSVMKTNSQLKYNSSN